MKFQHEMQVTRDLNLKLTDFGNAMKNIGSLNSSKKKQNTEYVGSIRWRSRESGGKNPKWTKKSDMFSLGMTMYEIASLKIPFEEESDDVEVALMIRTGERPTIPVDCPKTYRDLIEVMNERNRKDEIVWMKKKQ